MRRNSAAQSARNDNNNLFCYTSDRNVRLWLVQIASVV